MKRGNIKQKFASNFIGINLNSKGYTMFSMDKKMSKQAWVLTLFAVVSSIGVGMIMPYIPLYGEEIGIPITVIGYVVVAYYAAQAVFRVPIGSFTDFVGHGKVILLGALFFLLANFSYLFSQKIWLILFMAQIFFGIANSITWVTIPSYMTQTKNSMSIYTFSVGIGWLIGPPVGGFIKDLWGMELLFLALLAPVFSLAILSLMFFEFCKEEKSLEDLSYRDFLKIPKLIPPSGMVSYSIKSFSKALTLLKKNTKILTGGLFSFVVFMSFGLGASILPLYFSGIGISAFFIGIIQSTRTGTSALIRLAYTKITSWERELVLILGTLLVGFTIILTSLTSSLVPLFFLSFLWGVGSSFYLPIVFELMAEESTREERGVAMGIRGTMGMAGSMFGVWFFSLIAQEISLSFSLLSAGIFVVGCVFLLTLYIFKNH